MTEENYCYILSSKKTKYHQLKTCEKKFNCIQMDLTPLHKFSMSKMEKILVSSS